jgi:hypothetical protein
MVRKEKQKTLFFEKPHVEQVYREKVKKLNQKAKKKIDDLTPEQKEIVREKRRIYNREYYNSNKRKSPKKLLSPEKLFEREEKRKEKFKELYRKRTPEKKAQYAAAAKLKRDQRKKEKLC